MLAIRLQRTGRKGHAQYRVVVQDSHRSPLSGNVVEYLGSYNPHSKATILDTEKAQKYLDNGAQPSDRVVGLLKKEGVKLPKWVEVSAPGKRTTRNPEKLRKNQPEKPAEEAKPEASEAQSPKDSDGDAEASTTGETPEANDADATAEDAEPAKVADAPAESDTNQKPTEAKKPEVAEVPEEPANA